MILVVTLERDWNECQLKTKESPEGMAKLVGIILRQELSTQTIEVVPDVDLSLEDRYRLMKIRSMCTKSQRETLSKLLRR